MKRRTQWTMFAESLVTLAGLLLIYGLALAGIAYGLLT